MLSLLLVVMLVGLAILWFYITRQVPLTYEQLSPEPAPVSPKSTASEVTVGYGSSTKDAEYEAVNEAVAQALKPFNGEAPEYAILFSTVGYDVAKVVQETRKLLPATKFLGGTSMFGVFTTAGYHVGGRGSLAILAVSSPRITFGVGGADITKFSGAEEAGREAINLALASAGKTGEKPTMVYIMGSFGNEEALLSGIEQVVGTEVPIVGGSAFDDDASGKWSEFVGDQVYTTGVALTVFFTDLKVAWAYESGYDKTTNRGVITKASGRTIEEIDNQPALDVYNEWTGGLVTEMLPNAKDGVIVNIQDSALNPIAKILRGTRGEVHYLSMHPYYWDLTKKSINLGANVATGEEVTLMHGTWETNLNHARVTPSKALASKNIQPGTAYFGIFSYCVGKLLTLPEGERDKIPLLVNQSLGDISFIGANTGGEQGYLEGVGNRHGDLIAGVIIFGPEY
ncbi:MAG: putative secreted protein [Parcubacteria group bacterium GW2011_GWC2_44_22]|nr:MAG: putative secreted protein [Parcubacteria group bacterium GW2011_GWC2_44_22]